MRRPIPGISRKIFTFKSDLRFFRSDGNLAADVRYLKIWYFPLGRPVSVSIFTDEILTNKYLRSIS